MSSDGTNLSDFSMLDLFRMELDNQVAVLNQGLLELEKSAFSSHALESLMRAAHSVKGAARMVDVNAVVRVAHVMEECFVHAQKRTLKLNQDDMDVLLSSVDMLDLIGKSDDEHIVQWEQDNEAELNRIEMQLSELASKGKGDNLVVTPHEIDAQLLKDGDGQVGSRRETSKGEHNSLRVDVNRVNRILSLAGESIVESHRLNAIMETFSRFKKHQNILVDELEKLRMMLQESSVGKTAKNQFQKVYVSAIRQRQDLNEKIAELDSFDRRNALLIERLHEEVRSTRMRPMSMLVQAFPRMVRDLGRELKKKVKLNMSGLAILVDREVLERIDTSLKHLIQNAIDHGIEDESTRVESGKSPEGNISLSVSQSAGMLFIIIEDDGGGVDIDALKKKVVKKGYASNEELARMDNASLLDFLFMPGFSTRAKANTISGRGVGLDLVRETIESLGGSVFVTSQPDEGTRFQLLLPQTVSIMRILLTHINQELYGFPMSRVHRVTRIKSEEIASNESGYCCYFDDGTYQLVGINQLAGYQQGELGQSIDIVLLKDDETRLAVVVEGLLGQREVSIQRLDSDFGDIPGIDSAAILDNGELTLIFDTRALIQIYQGLHQRDEISLPIVAHRGNKRIMLICNSVTTRETARRFLSRYDYQVTTVKYGGHTLNRIRGQKPHGLVMCTDIGLDSIAELLEAMGTDEDLAKTKPMLLVDEADWRRVAEQLETSEIPQLDSKDIMRQVFLRTVEEMLGEKSL